MRPVNDLLDAGLNEYERKLNVRVIDRLRRDFRTHQRDRLADGVYRNMSFQTERFAKPPNSEDLGADETSASETAATRELYEFVKTTVRAELDRLRTLIRLNDEFQTAYSRVESTDDQHRLILEFARNLGATPRQLQEDDAALRRWFDRDAVTERFVRRRSETEQQIAFCIERLGAAAAQLLQAYPLRESVDSLWRRLEIETVCQQLLNQEVDERVHLACLRGLTHAVGGLNATEIRRTVSQQTIDFVSRAATDPSQPIWVQCESLSLLRWVSPETFRDVLTWRLMQPEAGDDMFVRRRAIRLLGSLVSSTPSLLPLARAAREDASPFVRQAVVEICLDLPPDAAAETMQVLACDDSVAQVRAAMLVEAIRTADREELHHAFLKILSDALDNDRDPFVLRAALHAASEWFANVVARKQTSAENQPAVGRFRELVLPAIRRLRESSDLVPVRRYAAQSYEQIWLASDPHASQLATELRKRIDGLRIGKRRRMPKSIFRGFDETTIGRVLSVLTQDDFGLDLERSWHGNYITRGPRMAFRLWRFLLEFRTPSPDKRQAFNHTIGRVSYASVRAPSGILAELSETKVPGEPLFQASEGGWKPYLPLVDDAISSLNQVGTVRPVRFYSSEGVTEMTPPRWSVQRLWAYICLTLRFTHYARLRNWAEDSQWQPAKYLEELGKLGFAIEFTPHKDDDCQPAAADSSVAQFFPCLMAIAAGSWFGEFGESFSKYASYFTSVYENSLPQLLVFILAFLFFFFSKHLLSNLTLRRARRSIPLSIGGWGTRGKSGTERLKAALLNALGYGIFSKSSGCEAMFLYAPTFGKLREFHLYRPYDKATIWEHRNVLLLASRLRSHLFIWECMGLTPSYVDVLSRQWTRDDLATITNTFPDHEDLQGPAGINVAEVIAGFVPHDSTVFTTEQSMRPVLVESARKVNARLKGVGWLESGLLTHDVLDRFPYTEHPDNIALVLAMAEELGSDHDFALKEMADRMVADLGVLKTSPPARMRTRTLEFTNGMSANERHGCLGNWQRLGFETQDHIAEPNVWVTTVVNNRADRIARSNVFARILVHDISADRHVLIGNNLKGLQRYIRDAWQEFTADLSLWNDGGNKQQALVQLDSMAKRFRQYTDSTQIQSVLWAMLAVLEKQMEGPMAEQIADELSKLWNDPNRLSEELARQGLAESLTTAIIAQLDTVVCGYREYSEIAQRIYDSSATQQPSIDADFKELLWNWFERKLVVVEDYYATGEQIIDRLCNETPPGFRNRIIGIQNIKGTGLDFVYRWQAWEHCHAAAEKLNSDDAVTAQHGLRELAELQDFGLLSEEFLQTVLTDSQESPIARSESGRATLEAIETKLQLSIAKINNSLQGTKTTRNSRLDTVLAWIEQFADVTDAVRRRKQANQIYRDLANEHISQEQAALQLRAITKRQKGGWLAKAFHAKRKTDAA